MTSAALLMLLQTMPTLIPLAVKLIGDVEAGKGNNPVSAADLQKLIDLGNQTAEDIYARLGILPPPPKPVAVP